MPREGRDKVNGNTNSWWRVLMLSLGVTLALVAAALLNLEVESGWTFACLMVGLIAAYGIYTIAPDPHYITKTFRNIWTRVK